MDSINIDFAAYDRLFQSGRKVHQDALFADTFQDFMDGHAYLMENPCRLDSYAIHTVYNENRFLDL